MITSAHPNHPKHRTRIPEVFYDAWRTAALASAKFPRGAVSRDMPAASKISKLLKLEHSGIARLWDTYTTDRQSMTKAFVGGKAAAMPYLLGFHLANMARAQAITERALQGCKWSMSLDQEVLVQDLGCGTGAVSAGVIAALQQMQPFSLSRYQLELCDQSGPLLDLAREFWSSLPEPPQIRSFRKDVGELPSAPFVKSADGKGLRILTLGYVVNELLRQPRALRHLKQVLRDVRQHPTPTILIIVEPANQNPCRELMELRDEWLEQDWHVAYPCPAMAKECPMLARSRDWCYSEFNWDVPPVMKSVDMRLEIERNRLSTTAYVLTSGQPFVSNAQRQSVVVGRPVRGHGEKAPVDYLLCGGSQLQKSPCEDKATASLRGQMPLPT